jgi:hypothetical protein
MPWGALGGLSMDGADDRLAGANILLAYFHYCNKGIYPFSRECKDQELRALAQLDEAMVQFVRDTRSYATDHSEYSPQKPTRGQDTVTKPRPWSSANVRYMI